MTPPAPRAKDAETTMLVGPNGFLLGQPSGEYDLRMMAEIAGVSVEDFKKRGYRIARVRITEIREIEE